MQKDVESLAQPLKESSSIFLPTKVYIHIRTSGQNSTIVLTSDLIGSTLIQHCSLCTYQYYYISHEMDVWTDAEVLVDPMEQKQLDENLVAVSHLTVSRPSPNIFAGALQLSSLSVRCYRLIRSTSACSGKW